MENTPMFCGNNCGFYGSKATDNLCSKCYNHRLSQVLNAESSSSSPPTATMPNNNCSSSSNRDGLVSSINPRPELMSHNDDVGSLDLEAKNRCMCCNKKVGLVGFTCKCGATLCAKHRYPEEHPCFFDYKTVGRLALARQNPFITHDKLERRI